MRAILLPNIANPCFHPAAAKDGVPILVKVAWFPIGAKKLIIEWMILFSVAFALFLGDGVGEPETAVAEVPLNKKVFA